MPVAESITVESIQTEIRLCDYCKNRFINLPSGKSLKKALDHRKIFVNRNSVHATTMIKSGDLLELHIDEVQSTSPEIAFHVYYSDAYLAIIEKPAGLSSSGNLSKSVQHYVASQFAKSEAPDAIFPARIVHRLDKSTSGLMIIARTAEALMKLGQAFEEREIGKKYLAIVHGKIENLGSIDTEIEGKSAHSAWVKLNDIVHSNTNFSLLELSPTTGRKHQLRIHLSSLGHAIAGDQEYNELGKTIIGRGMLLHAFSLIFRHPITNEEMYFESALPKRFKKLLERSRVLEVPSTTSS